MQYDSKSLIAEEVTPRIVAALQRSGDPNLGRIADLLTGWDYRAPVDAVQPAIYEMFMDLWVPAYAAATLPDQSTVRAAAGQAARRALVGEENTLDRVALDALIVQTARAALEELTSKFGPDPSAWFWGRVHYLTWPHPLGERGRLGELLNGPAFPCGGTDNTINNVAPSTREPFVADSGPTYRLIADLSDPGTLYINSHCPTSGHPGSPHYADTIRDWASGNYQRLRRIRALIDLESEGTTVIRPG